MSAGICCWPLISAAGYCYLLPAAVICWYLLLVSAAGIFCWLLLSAAGCCYLLLSAAGC
jgi:hypothetical protein